MFQELPEKEVIPTPVHHRKSLRWRRYARNPVPRANVLEEDRGEGKHADQVVHAHGEPVRERIGPLANGDRAGKIRLSLLRIVVVGGRGVGVADNVAAIEGCAITRKDQHKVNGETL